MRGSDEENKVSKKEIKTIQNQDTKRNEEIYNYCFFNYLDPIVCIDKEHKDRAEPSKQPETHSRFS